MKNNSVRDLTVVYDVNGNRVGDGGERDWIATGKEILVISAAAIIVFTFAAKALAGSDE